MRLQKVYLFDLPDRIHYLEELRALAGDATVRKPEYLTPNLGRTGPHSRWQ